MAGFGFLRNAVSFVSSKFAAAGKTFADAWEVFKPIIQAENKLKAYRVFREAKEFRRLRPFVGRVPGWLEVPGVFITSTTARLRNRFQYMFDVTFQYKGILLPETHMFSFLSPVSLTKNEVQQRMQLIIEQHYRREKYQEIDNIEVNLAGIRKTRWLP